MPTHLICDCDGVLIDSEAIALEVLTEELGRRLPGHDLAAAVRSRLGQMLETLLAEVAGEVGAFFGLREVGEIRHQVEGEILRRQRAVAGVAEALGAIHLPKAVASNSTAARVGEALRRTGLWPHFDGRIYTAEAVGAAKPQPDVYLAACTDFGVAPDACVVVEDSVTGVTAAAAAGMRVLGFAGAGHVAPGHAEKLRAAGASIVFSDMGVLPDLIRNLCAQHGATHSL